MNKRDIIAKYGADKIWNNNFAYVANYVQKNMCAKCKPEICESPCINAHNTITNVMWQVLNFYAMLN